MKKVLLCDDALFIRKTIEKILEENGYEISAEAGNGDQAVEMYKNERPDAVFMDICMPGMSGIATTREIMEYDPTAIVIMCSAMGQEDMIVKAINAGAKDFIVKPFTADKILKAINKWCK